MWVNQVFKYEKSLLVGKIAKSLKNLASRIVRKLNPDVIEAPSHDRFYAADHAACRPRHASCNTKINEREASARRFESLSENTQHTSGCFCSVEITQIVPRILPIPCGIGIRNSRMRPQSIQSCALREVRIAPHNMLDRIHTIFFYVFSLSVTRECRYLILL